VPAPDGLARRLPVLGVLELEWVDFAIMFSNYTEAPSLIEVPRVK
jgi:hypothetical protein